jgi:2-succinyl-6-hydroxy-2,4-cyclohexadiene-1-carboxylate synthase
MASLAATCAGAGPTVIVLHGFTQTAVSMSPLVERLTRTRRVVALDLPGHGGSAGISADLDKSAALVVAAADGEEFDLVGYSLGGRIALHVVCSNAPGLRRTAVISASPGIADLDARRRRLEADAALADGLVADGDVDAFLERWLRNPLFATLPAGRAGVESRRANTAVGLADSLRRCSVGTQRWLGDELSALEHPLFMLAGARDDAFVAAACTSAERGRAVAAAIVPGAGHVAHLEQPDVTARLLDAYFLAA